MTTKSASEKVCFVISPIGSADSDTRKRADKVLKHIFKAALEPLHYSVVRADEISQPGSITLQVLEKVLDSTLVIADLTEHNPNVFYELAVRHATQKPVIHVIDAGQKIPFDIADLRAVSLELDLDGAERAKKEITAQVQQIEEGHLGETPVKLAGVLKHLESGKSEEKLVLRQILEGISELRLEFRHNLERTQMQVAESVRHSTGMLRNELRDLVVHDTLRPILRDRPGPRQQLSDEDIIPLLDPQRLKWFGGLSTAGRQAVLRQLEELIDLGVSLKSGIDLVIDRKLLQSPERPNKKPDSRP
ncbi:MAG: hypothetical protein ABSD98_14945 [Candidatus Korobacteraceae bacterium]|jgi:hypothetical protein